MKSNRTIVLAGLCALVALATSCADQEARKAAAAAQATANAAQAASDGAPETLTRLHKYLTDQYVWEQQVFEAVCQIEKKNPAGLDPALRLCPGGGTGTKPPPAYPPQSP